jgi:hypothetical protein
MAERDKLNSEIMDSTPLSAIWNRLCLNALGELDPPLSQTEQMSISKVLDKHMPNLKATDHTSDGQAVIVNLQYADSKPA